MLQGRDAGIAKLLIADGSVRHPVTGLEIDNAGMGIVMDSRHVFTCAHVVNTALRLDEKNERQPDRKVSVMFPLSEGDQPIDGKVIVWYSMRGKGIVDIAVIELEADVPSDVGTARFARAGAPLDGDLLKVYGVRAGEKKGKHVEAKFMGLTSLVEAQLDGTKVTGVFIQGGYSGAAVWDTDKEAVVGMVSAMNVNPADRVAFMIPISALEQAWPQLSTLAPYQNRPLPSTALEAYMRQVVADNQSLAPPLLWGKNALSLDDWIVNHWPVADFAGRQAADRAS